jgi:hypothetical protein
MVSFRFTFSLVSVYLTLSLILIPIENVCGILLYGICWTLSAIVKEKILAVDSVILLYNSETSW